MSKSMPQPPHLSKSVHLYSYHITSSSPEHDTTNPITSSIFAMRLFNVTTQRLESFNDEFELPNYATLSHTWGNPEDEITFQDVNTHLDDDVGFAQPSKAIAWDKMRGACAQALAFGCGHVWIDTFCIEKSSSAELQEAINSMFRWYGKAQMCLVYMSDVSTPDGPNQDGSEFQRSRWFSRGWTLQELVAPSRLVFFDKHWNVIGEASNLSATVSEITGIRREFLVGQGGSIREHLSRASIAERMSWASRRHTTRPEDMAYCLLGIFGIHMPMLYGEGWNAFKRLQEEIMKTTDDSSLLAWGLDRLGTTPDLSSILAPTPEYFEHCAKVYQVLGFWHVGQTRPSFFMTQRGLVIQNLPLVQVGKLLYLILNCGVPTSGIEQHFIAVPFISAQATGQEGYDIPEGFVRPSWCMPILVPLRFLRSAKRSSLLILRPSATSDKMRRKRILSL